MFKENSYVFGGVIMDDSISPAILWIVSLLETNKQQNLKNKSKTLGAMKMNKKKFAGETSMIIFLSVYLMNSLSISA